MRKICAKKWIFWNYGFSGTWLGNILKGNYCIRRWTTLSLLFQFNSVQPLSHVQLFVNQWTAARQASLPFTISWSSLKILSIESMMPSSHLNPCCPLLLLPQSFLASGSFPMNWLFTSVGQSIGDSASASVLPMNTQDWFPLELTGWICLQSKRLSRVFSSTKI